tara:strand:- start:623 stop:1729 length:1107 start_codon:yes stop_codon:yes gene_type:complete
MKIPYTKPSITKLEVEYACDAAATGWGDKCYEYIHKFEKAFARYLGVKHCIATSSCTGAMHMGLHALGIGPGDEVILADTNWIATASPIVHLGAKPVFVDILSNTWCIDPEKVKASINSRTKAVIATHLYGNLCEIEQLKQICSDANINLIEDAAEAIGSSIGTKKAGTMSEFSTFSFHGSKTITTGEGGILATNNSEIYDKAFTLSNHGRSKNQNKQFWPDEVGYKFKMSNVQAAIGLAQLKRIETLVLRKRAILEQYKYNLKDLTAVFMNPELSGTINGAWMPTAVFDKSLGIDQKRLLQVFTEQKIDARVFFWPLSSLPMFKENLLNRNSYDIPTRSINLPSFHDIRDDQINQISEIIIKLVANG